MNLVGLLYLVSHFLSILNLNVTPFSNIYPEDSWLGSPVLNFENVPSFLFFLYSALHLLKNNLFNAKQDLERSVILQLV